MKLDECEEESPRPRNQLFLMKALKTKDPERSRKGRKAIVREAKYGRKGKEIRNVPHT